MQEVKASEEWEAVQMNILEIGIEHGIEKGEYKKLCNQVEKKLNKGCSVTEIADMLEESEDVIAQIIKEIQTK